MSLTVGTDSYVTVDEADAYVSTYYVSTDAQRVAWEALTDTDKEIYLRNALISIEQLPFLGEKYLWSDQNLAFPRIYPNLYIEHDLNLITAPTVPNDIKNSQILEALELASPTQDTKDAEVYGGNVKSYSVGHLSETLITGSRAGLRAIIKSSKAQLLLKKYVGGGYSVR